MSLTVDEPTTGLDSAAAMAVMQAVRKLASKISVICTIHQPSAEIVSMFDYMLLMSRGEVAYYVSLLRAVSTLDALF